MNKQDREKVRQAIRLLREVLEKETTVETQDIDPEGGGGGPGTPPPPPPPPPGP